MSKFHVRLKVQCHVYEFLNRSTCEVLLPFLPGSCSCFHPSVIYPGVLWS